MVLPLLKRLATLETRLNQHSSNSSRPPSTDAPSTKRQRRKPAVERWKPGGKPGHPGHPQALLEPTTTVSLFPEGCSCGPRELVKLTPYHTHQVIELPYIRPDVTHWRLGSVLKVEMTAKLEQLTYIKIKRCELHPAMYLHI